MKTITTILSIMFSFQPLTTPSRVTAMALVSDSKEVQVIHITFNVFEACFNLEMLNLVW